MSYNFLKRARKINNSLSCVHDSNDAFTTNFEANGDVDGWDVYYNVYFYGCWENILFGTSADRYCYINRTDNFLPVAAEDYHYVKIMMKITNNNLDKVNQGLTKGKLQWLTLTDNVWNDKKSFDFDITADDQWHLYSINVGPARYWVGDVFNIRLYPFLDGWEGDQFIIKYIKIGSTMNFTCKNTQCSYYLNYEHPCQGMGVRGNCEAGVAKDRYTTTSGSDLIKLNIDGYGDTSFHIGQQKNLDIYEISSLLGKLIGSLSVGGYCYSSVGVSEKGNLEITSGTVGQNSSVVVKYSPVAVELGFYDTDGEFLGTIIDGVDAATGFDYNASRLLTILEINNLRDGNSDSVGYVHNAKQFNVEAGRSDYNEIGYFATTSVLLTPGAMEPLANRGNTIIDWSHPFNSNGSIKHIYIYATRYENSRIKICRPLANGLVEVIHSLSLPNNESTFQTRHNAVHHIDCNILVNKGDVLAIYDMDVSIGISVTGVPDATYSQVEGEPSGLFDPGVAYSTGVGGVAIYARSDRYQTTALLDIDLGERVNIEECTLYGVEEDNYYEYNIAMCLDVNWRINLHGGTHKHRITYVGGSYTVYHTNISYGKSALSDGKIVAENGVAGDSYSKDSTGVVTVGEHSYFYVNGDAEWLQPEEFSYTVKATIEQFTYDPITLTLVMPADKSCLVHKSIMHFKERDNFKNFSLYYGLDSLSTEGNYIDSQHKLIPVYNSVTMDGVRYDSDNNEDIAPYMFSNPCSVEAEHNGEGIMINTVNFFAAMQCSWTVLEHEFTPVDAHDFNIYCTYHNSTKIAELEVYSRAYLEPSLIDNTQMKYSAFGIEWKDAIFTTQEGAISAFIGGSPQFIQLLLQTTSSFTLNEISITTGDQVKTTKCDTLLLLDDTKSGAIGESTEFVIENIYDRPFDLIVDLPKDTSSSNGLIYWSKLGGQEDILSPSVGPPAILRKAKDKKLLLQDKQFVINNPCYGLMNIVDGKEAYYTYNNITWEYYGTLVSGTSISFYKNEYTYTHKNSITFPAVSSKYYKIVTTHQEVIKIRDVEAYYEGSSQLIDKVYYNSPIGTSAQTNYIECDGTYLIGTDAFIEDFNGNDYSAWDISTDYVTGDEFLTVESTSATGCTILSPYFTPISNFEFSIDFAVSQAYVGTIYYEFNFYNDADILFKLKLNSVGNYGECGHGDWVCNFYYPTDTALISSTVIPDHCLCAGKVHTIKLLRAGTYITIYIDEFIVGTVNTPGVDYVNRWEYHNATGQSIGTVMLHNIYFRRSVLLSPDTAIGIALKVNDPLDTINLLSTSDSFDYLTTKLYTSINNLNYVLRLTGLAVSNSEHFVYFVIDLQSRHNLDIIRNYGTLDNKLFLDAVDSLLDYSNTTLDAPIDIEFGNSTKIDARWVRIKITASDGITSCLDKLGIYPNTAVPYCMGGGYNCSWQSIGNTLSDYTHPINVAYGATATSDSYLTDMGPDKVVDGIFDTEEMRHCWAFDGETPEIELLFNDTYTINKIRIYHGYGDINTAYVNNDFNISVSTTVSGGDFTTIFTVIDNTSSVTDHNLVYAVDVRRLKLQILDYTSEPIELSADELFSGSFIREIEVYAAISESTVDSETWPVVCIDLKDKFTVATHELLSNSPINDDDKWDNSDEFFKYSESLQDTPKKVPFNLDGDITAVYSTYETSENQVGYWEYIFDTDIYIEDGTYIIVWQGYDLDLVGESGVRIEGNSVIDVPGPNEGPDNWADQEVQITIPESGYYTIKGRQYVLDTYDWGVRNIVIYRTSSYAKWILVKRDTATDYSYEDVEDTRGIDVLSKVRVYGADDYSPTSYSWWWKSLLSTLTNDYLFVTNDGPSLKIEYPESTEQEEIMFIPGDTFGTDYYWSIRDLLSFDLYISDITDLDIESINVNFGFVSSIGHVYYGWSLEECSLVSGWNSIRLKFEDRTYMSPYDADSDYYLDTALDFIDLKQGLDYFTLRYKGVGNQLTFYLTSIKIERNSFDCKAKFGQGLCLTNNDFIQVPISGLNLSKGSIEFWLKPYYDSYGRDIFNTLSSRTLFSIVNNDNNIISLGIKAGHWFALYVGDLRSKLLTADPTEELARKEFFNIDELIHMAVVWSNNGTAMDNKDTFRFYVNNNLAYSSTVPWEVGDLKDSILRLSGGNTPLAYNYDSPSGGGIFDNLKVYDYCKSDFDISMEGIQTGIIYDVNNYVEISIDNINFYGVDSLNLPVTFVQVPNGDKRSIYIRSNKTVEGFDNSAKTADLLVSWLTTV